jgi:hypothetical protein
VALTNKDLEQIQALVDAAQARQAENLTSQLAAHTVKVTELLRGHQEALREALASQLELFPHLDPEQLIKAVREELAPLPGALVDALRQEAPKLFGEAVADAALKTNLGTLSLHHWVVEADGAAFIPEQGSVKLKKGQILDRRSSPVEAIRKGGVAVRRLFVQELPPGQEG